MPEPTIKLDGKDVTIAEAKLRLNIPKDSCFGCYMGDASPDAHDYGYGCEYGGHGDA